MNRHDFLCIEPGLPSHHRHSPWRRGQAHPAPDPRSTRLPLATGEMCWIEDGGTFFAHCARGSLWITAPDLHCDVLLSEGESLEMPTRGKLLIIAMSDSALWLPPGYRLDDGRRRSTTRRIVGRPQCA